MTLEELMQDRERKSRAEGKAEGIAFGILNLLTDIAPISAELEEKIKREGDLEVLKSWHKLAAKVSSIEEFVSKM